MKRGNCTLLVVAGVSMLCLAANAFASSFVSYTVKTETAVIDAWIHARGGAVNSIKDFNRLPSGWNIQVSPAGGGFNTDGVPGVRADTAIATSGQEVTHQYTLEHSNAWFEGITLDLGEELSSRSWSTDEPDGEERREGQFGTTQANVPEPATMLLFGAGLAGFVGVLRKRK